MKSVLWRVAKRLSYIEDARCLKVKFPHKLPEQRKLSHHTDLRVNKDVSSVTTRVPSLDVIGNRFPDTEEIGKMSRIQGRVCLMVGILYCGNASELWSEKEEVGGGKRQLEGSVQRAQVPCLGQM